MGRVVSAGVTRIPNIDVFGISIPPPLLPTIHYTFALFDWCQLPRLLSGADTGANAPLMHNATPRENDSS
jgi:hypothetical protein